MHSSAPVCSPTIAHCHQFRGTNVLSVNEAQEPQEIYWSKIGTATPEQVVVQRVALIQFLCIFCVLDYLLVATLMNLNKYVGSALISITNIAVPAVMKTSSDVFEVHEIESTRIMSLFNKIALFRYFNTAIIILLITKFEERLTEETLSKVQSIIILLYTIFTIY
jgi:hypothetical protein